MRIFRRLDSNALVCDCEMLWFAQMLKRRQHSGSRVHAEATCHHPNNLHGRSLMRIDNDDFHCGNIRFFRSVSIFLKVIYRR